MDGMLILLFFGRCVLLITCRQEFKGTNKDDWTLPSANYEMACLAWHEKDLEGADPQAKVNECEKWLDVVHKWGEDYSLDTRMSLRVTTSFLTLKREKRILDIV